MLTFLLLVGLLVIGSHISFANLRNVFIFINPRKQIVRGENSSGHGMNGKESVISNGSEIKHTLHLTNVPGDPTYI